MEKVIESIDKQIKFLEEFQEKHSGNGSEYFRGYLASVKEEIEFLNSLKRRVKTNEF